MGEETKKPEENKVEEGKKAEGEAKKPEEQKKEEKKEEKKDEKKEEKKEEEKKEQKAEESKESPPPPPPPPEEFEYKVFMHCEGCARKVRRSLKGFEGVEDVQTDCKAHKVVVKGKTADPLKVLDRIQRKSHRKVELLTPLPKPPAEEPKKEEEKPKKEEKKEEPQVITVVLKVHMHCEGCSQETRKKIMKMKGVEAAEPDLKSSQVIVKGVFDPPKLVEYVYKRTGRHAVIIKQDPEKKKEEEKGAKEEKEEKKEGGGEKEEKGDREKKENKEGEEGKGGEGEEQKAVEVIRNEYYYYPKYTAEYVYPPQIFSDENPNACSIM